MPKEETTALHDEIRLKASEALVRARAALLDAQLEVKKWEEFLREYQQSSD